MVINSANLRTMFTAFNAAFKSALGTAQPMWSQIATLVPSTTGTEEYGWLGMNTKFREWLGERQYQNLKTHGYSIKNKKFENTVAVPRDNIEDDSYGIFSPMMAQMGQDAALHPDSLIFTALLAGFSTPCFDGQYFIDTDHPVGQQGAEVSVSNFGGGSGAAWFLLDTTKVIKPMILQKRRDYNFVALTSLEDENVFKRDEFVFGSDARLNVGYGLWQMAYGSKQAIDIDVYTTAYTAMVGFKADNGNPLNVKPNIFLVGPSNWKKALECVTVERLANGADNPMKNTTTVVLCPWLA
ncbi:MAG: Mu-like prophage major head subunit gpT family protein [Burkholderiales bacterium]|nr:Mu-like prophage major head subunit gpT family protein [Burkholderiales bacterium]